MSSGSDAAWVDYIIFPPVATITSTGPETTTYSFGIYPNPTSGKLAISYHLTAEMQVKLTLSDETGRELMIVKPTEIKPAGNYTAASDLSELESGVYFVRMDAGSSSLTRKVILR
jgi:hypothetical protein